MEQKGYFYNDDTFNYNYGEAKVATGLYEEAEEILLTVQNEKFKNEYAYLSHLARCCKSMPLRPLAPPSNYEFASALAQTS